MLDRRQESRTISTFRNAYVRTTKGLHFVTLRNISDTGICLDGYTGVFAGEPIEYCCDSKGLRRGVVKWVKGSVFGISAEPRKPDENPAVGHFPPRSVRLPLTLAARLFVNGCPHQAIVQNLSPGGICISTNSSLAPGQLVTVELGNCCFAQATIRWAKQGTIGIRFASPIPRADFRALVDALQERTISAATCGEPEPPAAISKVA